MIPKIHKKGRSFRGAANYLLHDKDRAKSDDRVAWTWTRNLATTNPHAAWRVMAATAMDQGRLKQQAGVKNTGRKSPDSVLHVTLSWHPDEAEGLTKDEMMRAANGAIRALRADDRQALFVSHNDEPQPHVHVLINRVSPDDGRMLPSSKEKLNLSRWAQEYEQQRGEVLCEQRVINNAARDRDEYTRGEPDKPRHIYELEAANDNRPDIERIKEQQRKLDLALARRTREMRARQAQELARITRAQKSARSEINDWAKTQAVRARERVRTEFRPEWEQRYHEQQAARRVFDDRERQLLGRVGNALRSIDFKAMLSAGERRSAMKDVYNAISTSGGRLEAFRRRQELKDRSLEQRQRSEEAQAVLGVRETRDQKHAQQRERFRAERSSVVLKHRLEQAGNRSAWRTRSEQRRAAFEHDRPHTEGVNPNQTHQPTGKQAIEQDERTRRLLESYEQLRSKQHEQDPEKNQDRDDHER